MVVIDNERGISIFMFDMALAFKISGGGLGVVFSLLVVLWFTIWVTRVVTEKIINL